MTGRRLHTIAETLAGGVTGACLITTIVALLQQDWPRALYTATLLAAALLAWWATTRWHAHRTPPAGTCTHPAAVPVISTVTGQTLAALCPACGAQLPADAIATPAVFAGLRADAAAIHGILTDLDTSRPSEGRAP